MIQNCLIIQWTELPREIKEITKGWLGFGNDRLVPARSEFSGDWSDLSMDEIDAYRRAQTVNGNFEGTLKEFIEAYGLQFEIWIIESGLLEIFRDPYATPPERILLEISW